MESLRSLGGSGPPPKILLRAQTTHASPHQTAGIASKRPVGGQKENLPAEHGNGSDSEWATPLSRQTGTHHHQRRRPRKWANHSARASEWAKPLKSKRTQNTGVGGATQDRERGPPNAADTRDPNGSGRSHSRPRNGSHSTTAASERRTQAARAKPRHAGSEAQAVGEHRRPANQAEPGRKSQGEAGNRVPTPSPDKRAPTHRELCGQLPGEAFNLQKTNSTHQSRTWSRSRCHRMWT